MNNSFYNQYAELISELKIYISQEYSEGASLVAEPQNFLYFKEQAIQERLSKQSPKPASIPVLPPKKSYNETVVPTITASEMSSQKPSTLAFESTIPPLKTQKPNSNAENEKIELNKNLSRERLELTQTQDFAELRKLWQQQCPQHSLIDTFPSDEKAKAISQKWQIPVPTPEVLLLYFNENPREKAFLMNVATAISMHFAPAGLISASKIENEKGWPQLINRSTIRLVLAPHHSLETLPGLAQHYIEDQLRGKHTLGKVPILLLSDLSLYMQQPKLKLSLWHTLRQKLTSGL